MSVSAGERVLRIGVSLLLTLVFAAWSVDLFASQPSEITSVPFSQVCDR